ncbi:bifunctional UDP-N-acetylmuramoyl-tripeptide:D-alanyl-D-alanine ligase/alanine racemase [Microbacter margulisiae]|uniref:Alanine racemase n=1 Tax=Microbacter margulisiae TaxID=1350067 RepID=A0A7W5H208_9PORP|nr:bifunctional UDP-N-acetylmuramoyl-tripeptide:D-alanyl-D-alanine ligase/alanine racemase [Microbacter margulisiae]MBB3187235.1 alanine racemase [Microbacter margulisiae]
MDYSFFHIAQILGGTPLVRHDTLITRLLTDSRSLVYTDETLFFALRSSSNDGHRYVRDLYHRGVRNFVVSDFLPEFSALKEANFLTVPDTLVALQQLAAFHRNHFALPVVGITGSNGKTIVKEWLSQLLHIDYNTVRSPRSYNSQIGVPLSVWQLNEQHTLALFEAGISQKGEIERLEHIIRPTIGILTNIGQAHQENFNSLIEKCQEKLQLFTNSEWLISCKDQKLVEQCIEESGLSCHRFTWGYSESADLQIQNIEKAGKSTSIRCIHNDQAYQYTIPFIDDASVENSMHCLATWILLEEIMGGKRIVPAILTGRMNKLEPVAMRLEVKEGRNGCLVINDSYNADINSLSIALDFLRRQAKDKQMDRTLILSDILQSGEKSEILYTRIAQLVKDSNIQRFIGIGDEISQHASRFDTTTSSFYETTEEFLQSETWKKWKNEVILLKGSRKFHFEFLSEQLESVAHQTILEVNLGALVHNFNYFRSKLRPETRIVSMVKAFAYGSGAVEVARTLQQQHCNYLAVAVADEGVELRREGITIPIMVMNPEANSFNLLFEYQLEPEIYSLNLLNLFIRSASRQGITHYPIHVKIDSGMHRLGFGETDLSELLSLLSSNDHVHVQSVFSHLAGADETRFDDFTHQQAAVFSKCAEQIEQACGYPVLKHILNSAGIERFSEYQFDMVRLGIGHYGISAINSPEIENVCTLKTTVLQVRHVKAGETVGYSRRGVLTRDSVIAVLPIGYADGYDRRFGNGVGKVWINGKTAPVVGTVCMDVTMIDVTGLDVHEGDSALIFGDQLPLAEVAASIGTISYEILTNVSRRVKRVYFQE